MHVQYHHHRQNSSFHKKSKLGFIPEMKDNRVCVCVCVLKTSPNTGGHSMSVDLKKLIKLSDKE